jgi:hypothetical protein
MAAFAIGESGPAASFGGLTLEPLFSGASSSPFELSLAMAEIDGILTAKWTFQTDIFNRESVERMAQVRLALKFHIFHIFKLCLARLFHNC